MNDEVSRKKVVSFSYISKCYAYKTTFQENTPLVWPSTCSLYNTRLTNTIDQESQLTGCYNMQKYWNSAPANTNKSFLITATGEILLSCIALFLTVADITVRSIFYLIVKSFHLLMQLSIILIMAGIFLLAYLLIAGFHMFSGTGFNAN